MSDIKHGDVAAPKDGVSQGLPGLGSQPRRRQTKSAPAGRIARWLQIIGLVVLPLATVGVLDIVTGYRLQMSFFYLVPTFFAVLLAGRGGGILCALCAGAFYLADQLISSVGLGASLWNTAMRLGVLLFVAIILPPAIRQLDMILSEKY